MRLLLKIIVVIVLAGGAAMVIPRLEPAPVTGLSSEDAARGMRVAENSEDGVWHGGSILPPAIPPTSQPTTRP